MALLWHLWSRNVTSEHRGDAGARVAKHQCAIITVSRVAARRRHLAGCQTRWSPPSNSSDQNKGSVRNTDSCNISPGPGSHSISQNTDGGKYFLSLAPHKNIYEYFGGYCTQGCCYCLDDMEKVRRAVFFCATFGDIWMRGLLQRNAFSLGVI